ncbi:MAG: PKD domain-containing protein [Bacteroidales bacterium]|nr:PKD domain-containing protein [Bacteroidales bacterium]MCF8397325.1 PKD domain-containing protein [Bacteroidales bacterium]
MITFFSTVLFCAGQMSAQQIKNDPNLDRIPQWYLELAKEQRGERVFEIITIDGYDNYYVGLDFAEGHISVNPQEPTEFFNSFNIDNPHYTMDGHEWFDGDVNWGGANIRGDVLTAYDSLGNLYYENMYGSSIQGCKLVVSSDNGQSWSDPVTAINGVDKNWLAADQTAGPYANYVYSVMTGGGGVGNFTRSTDYGQSFQQTETFNTQSLPGMMVAVGPNGDVQGGSVYVVTNSGSAFASTYTFYRSTDGGNSFTQQSSLNVAGYVGEEVGGRNSVENMRTRPYPFIAADNSYGTYRGRLYLVYASNDPPGDGNKPDIWCRYSDDYGQTWSDDVRVNDDSNTQNHHQWQPAIWCDKETGKLYIQWMDTRDTPTSDSALIYATYSDDGGQTFKPNQAISNEKMVIDCETCGGGGTPRYQGDYNGIVSNAKVSMATWSDFRWGTFASFTSYFPDFAMTMSHEQISFAVSDTVWAEVPSVKLYEDYAIFTSVIEDPPSGSFSVNYPNGNGMNSFPGSVAIVITASGVPLGNYEMSVTGKGPNGTPIHKRTVTLNIVELQPPVADFSAEPTEVCSGGTVDFMDQSANFPSQWQWTFEGGSPGTSSDENPSGIVYDEPGTYDVTLLVSNDAGSDEITKTDFITVATPPDPPTGEDVVCCSNELVNTLIAEGENIIWYDDPELLNVVGEGDTLETGQTEAGIYEYYVTQTIGCESDAIILTLTINAAPEVTLDPFDEVCESVDPFELSGGLPEGGNYFGTGVEGNIFDPFEAGAGTHMIAYVYTDANTCSDTAYAEMTVLESPEVYVAPFAPVCLNDEPFELSGGMPAGGEYSGNGVDDNYFIPAEAGTGMHMIKYTYTAPNGCSNSAQESIQVNEVPSLDIGPDTTICNYQNVVLDATIPDGANYLWTPGNLTTASITVDSLMIGIGATKFHVIATNINNCSVEDSVTVTIEDCTGMEEISGLTKLDIFPNPNKGSFTISMSTLHDLKLKMKLIDAGGKSLLNMDNISIQGKYRKEIELGTKQKGIFILILENDTGRLLRKILVQ